MIEKRTTDSLQDKFGELCGLLDELTPQAEGEIQERSVKNLGIKLKILNGRLDKLKTKRAASASRDRSGIIWDEKRIAELATPFLEKVLANTGDDSDSRVCFGTSGKGIRPNYHIHFGSGEKTSYSGSNHKPDGKAVVDKPKKMSSLFPQQVIADALASKG
ncbi:MAG: hypothetical protein MI747_18125 [Desulfobacterales bacterium]|nr:hypothetical protein [Desulfobacterales bacterium]